MGIKKVNKKVKKTPRLRLLKELTGQIWRRNKEGLRNSNRRTVKN